MVSISGTTIKLTRGDTAAIALRLRADGEQFELEDGDRAVFSVKRGYDDAEYVLQADASGGIVELSHADTQGLASGSYVWDVQVTLADGQVATVGPGRLKLLPDVTGE